MQYKRADSQPRPGNLRQGSPRYRGIPSTPSAKIGQMKIRHCGPQASIGTIARSANCKPRSTSWAYVPPCENMPGGVHPPGDSSSACPAKPWVSTPTQKPLCSLCDALTYARRYDPVPAGRRRTLTGACVVAARPPTGLFAHAQELPPPVEAGNVPGPGLAAARRRRVRGDARNLPICTISAPYAAPYRCAIPVPIRGRYALAHLDIAGRRLASSGKRKGARAGRCRAGGLPAQSK